MQPQAPQYSRIPTTDDEVRRYIRDELKRHPSMKHTSLLRQFRDSGRACEQGRFRRLFYEVVGASNAG